MRIRVCCEATMKRNIPVIQGHADPRGNRFGHALAAGDAASAAGHSGYATGNADAG